MFPFLLALLFNLKIRLGVKSNILGVIKKRYVGEGKKLFRTYEAVDANCFGETFYQIQLLIKMFPFLLALLFILKIRLWVQSNNSEFIKKRYGGEGKKLFRTYEADDANCFGETFY